MKATPRFRISRTLIATLAFVAGTAFAGEGDAKRILGDWELDYNGMSVAFNFSDKGVSVMGMAPSPYQFDGTKLSMDPMGNHAEGNVVFVGDSEMQLLTTSGEKQIFKRTK
ncbi:MAG: hypothetical protein JSR19_13675 [Proteobacteria bacterium]|nr:hypothetical protein [Pseudomonadota bacterium]HQR02740.1 hypothetical protein [Rhodocyclaceae bacterium]